jgi:hypothetical protein
VRLRVAYGSPELGSDLRTVPLSATGSWALGSGDTFARASVTAATRVYDGRTIDRTFQALAYLASPMLGRVVRVVLYGEADGARSDTQNTRYFLGGDVARGAHGEGGAMRGYAIGEFTGTVMYVAHAELRTAPLAIFSQRFGTLLFVDAGDAANAWGMIRLYTDVGTGLRWLIPQANSTVLRIDWAVPLQDGPVTPAGFPGRFSAGFQQAF